MKKFLLFALILIVTATLLTLCNKESKGLKMNAEDLKTKYAIIFPDLQYESDEPATVMPGSTGNKKAKASAVSVTVFENALPIAISGTTISSEAPVNTQWFGGQKFIDTTTNTGAVGIWGCGRLFNAPNNEAKPVFCQTEGPAFYRVFASDFQYNVRLSKFEIHP